MKFNHYPLLVLLSLVAFCFGCSQSASVDPTPDPNPTPTPVKPSQVSSFTGVYEMTTINYSNLPEVKGVGSLTITALSDTTIQVDQVRSLTLVSTGEVEPRTSRDTCTINSNATYTSSGVSYKPFTYTKTREGLSTWGYLSIADSPKTGMLPETMNAVKNMPAYKDKPITHISYYTRKP